MRVARPTAVYLKDYRPPAYRIHRTQLHFELHEDCAIVSSSLHLERDETVARDASLALDGEELELLSVAIDGRELDAADYRVQDGALCIHKVPGRCVVSCRTRIRPQDNTSLSGLYRSRGLFCTQCEAEGFRRITYYLDRPDVLSVFTVTIDADRDRYPLLLGNGNPVDARPLEDGRHRAIWHDPFPKPAYLFALVAGDLANLEDSFTTASGRQVCLRIHTQEKDIDKCDHAMRSLKRAMRWDEEVYGREYDLDVFNIVAVDDFNMGAMENKGLNIFNTSCVLCSPQVTTDSGFQRVEAIIAHEYFHNWSGNRVTCRDWFQLSLKEGFTVFRDAQFSADMGSPTIKRVEDATVLRTAQFAEDAGPLAHPVRPESYIEINNFYTLTVYEKGAEVVRMLHTLLGAAAFRRGCDLYFARHDGQAVTCEDFVRAMEDASGRDLRQFRNWYSQAGTPELAVSDDYDPVAQRYTLHVAQSCPATPGQSGKQPFVIPLAMGLLGANGNLPLRLVDCADGPACDDSTHAVLTIDQPRQSFVFEAVGERPVPSLLRGFSAPVRLQYDYTSEALCALMSRDSDGFVRWDSAQALATRVIVDWEARLLAEQEPVIDRMLVDACGELLRNASLDAAMVAGMLQLPSEEYLAELASQRGGANVDSLHAARNGVKRGLGLALEERFLSHYQRLRTSAQYRADASQVAARSLRNTCLSYLVAADARYLDLAVEQFHSAGNMTDRLAALREIALHAAHDLRERTLAHFYRDWRHEPLVVNQWFQVQAAIPDSGALSRVQALLSHPDFDMRNPNKVRALVGGFTSQNPVNFHRLDGAGYRFLGDIVKTLDRLNPQIAARLLTPLAKWGNYTGRSGLMRDELARLAQVPDLSPDVFEVVTKSLRDDSL